jgi:Zn-dependent protease
MAFAPPRAAGYSPPIRMESSALVVRIAIVAVPLVLAIVCHEVAHGGVAWLCGDATAQRLGRLTLNPLRHVDPIGTVLVPGMLAIAPLVFGTPPFLFGWAKPVPIDPRNFGHPRRDEMLVALAGPGTNLVLATACALGLGALSRSVVGEPSSGVVAVARMLQQGIVANCVLAVFNLIPVPPLDGGRVLSALLPFSGRRALASFERVGMVVVLLVAFNTGVVGMLVQPVVRFFFRLAQ